MCNGRPFRGIVLQIMLQSMSKVWMLARDTSSSILVSPEWHQGGSISGGTDLPRTAIEIIGSYASHEPNPSISDEGIVAVEPMTVEDKVCP